MKLVYDLNLLRGNIGRALANAKTALKVHTEKTSDSLNSNFYHRLVKTDVDCYLSKKNCSIYCTLIDDICELRELHQLAKTRGLKSMEINENQAKLIFNKYKYK